MAERTAPGDEYVNPLGNCRTRLGKREYLPGQREFIAETLTVLEQVGVPVLVAGAFAHHAYTGIWRNTKDMDVFLRGRDVAPALAALDAAGFETELREPHWLAKAWRDGFLLDLIFGTGNHALRIDDSWFERGVPIEIVGRQERVVAPEDLIASKAYIAKRDRFDGADIAHIIRCRGGMVDWQRVLALLGEDRQLLLWHLILFDWVYPSHSHCLPAELMETLWAEARARWAEGGDGRAFRGTLLDEQAFGIDVADWGYDDARPVPVLGVEEETE